MDFKRFLVSMSLKSAKSEKYDHINFKPPKAVADAAKKGLEYRAKQKKKDKAGLTNEEASKAGIGSGVQRAVNLKNRNEISPKVIKQMNRFFPRHEENKSIDLKYKDEPWEDNGHVSWLLWGSDPGKVWAEKVVTQMEKADEKSKQKKASLQNLSMKWYKFLGSFTSRNLGSEYPQEAKFRKILNKIIGDATRDLINGKLSEEEKLETIKSFRKDLMSLMKQVQMAENRESQIWNFGRSRYLSILEKFDTFFYDLRRMRMASLDNKEKFLQDLVRFMSYGRPKEVVKSADVQWIEAPGVAPYLEVREKNGRPYASIENRPYTNARKAAGVMDDWIHLLYEEKGVSRYASQEMSFETFAAILEREFRKYFPRGYFYIVKQKSLGSFLIQVQFALLPKGAQPNGYLENDPSFNQFFVQGIERDGQVFQGDSDFLKSKVQVKMLQGNRLYGPNASNPEKIGWRNGKGSPQSVLKKFSKYFLKIHQMIARRPDLDI